MIKSGQHFDSEYRWWSRRVEVQKSDIEMVILVKPVRDLVILDFEVPHLALYSGPEVEEVLVGTYLTSVTNRFNFRSPCHDPWLTWFEYPYEPECSHSLKHHALLQNLLRRYSYDCPVVPVSDL